MTRLGWEWETEGPSVSKVQQALVDLDRGYDLGSSGPGRDGVDSSYGPKTAAAVRQFKHDENLGFEQFGDIGPGTMHRLDEIFGPGPISCDVDETPSSDQNVDKLPVGHELAQQCGSPSPVLGSSARAPDAAAAGGPIGAPKPKRPCPTCRCKLSPEMIEEARLTANVGFNDRTVVEPGLGVMVVRSPDFRPTGRVKLRDECAIPGAYKIGLIQNLLDQTVLKGYYFDAKGNPTVESRETYSSVPTRDGPSVIEGQPGSDRPYYGPETVKPVDANGEATTTMLDHPQTGLRIDPPRSAGTGTLGASSGRQIYGTWLVLEDVAAGEILSVKFMRWVVDYSAAIDTTNAHGSTGLGICGVLEVLDGKGGVQPVLVPPATNDTKTKVTFAPSSP